jgi:Zn-dependent protease with chaperone function
MEIIIKDDNNRVRMEEALARITNDTLNNLIHELRIVLTDELTATSIYNDEYNIFSRSFENGLGGNKGNVIHGGQRKHLVVVNFGNVDLIELDNDELDAVLIHELGHLLNKNNPLTVTSAINGATQEEIRNVQITNSKNSEFFADYLAKLLGKEAALISSIRKFLDSELRANEDLFQERIKKLDSDEELNGVVLTMLN